LPRLLSFGTPVAVARAARGWLRSRIAALLVPVLENVPVGGGEHSAPRQLAAVPGISAPDSPTVGRARLAVLIDADNARASMIEQVLAEVATFGTAHVRRAYGDWTGSDLRSWKDQVLAYSIQPMQQFAYVAGKNATDAAMVIDAMDLLHGGGLDGFCLVSSDSDFTRLAARLRESGRIVYGFGERKTPRSFVAACDRFVYVENLTGPPTESTSTTPPLPRPAETLSTEAADSGSVPRQHIPGAQLRGDTRLVTWLREAVEEASDDDGWASQANVGNIIGRRNPDFDPRDWGYKKLGELVSAIDLFEIERRVGGAGKATAVYLRDKRHRRVHPPTAGRGA